MLELGMEDSPMMLRLALAVAVSALAIAAADARPRTITVHPRSYLDAGRVAPVGTYTNYVNVGQYPARPVYFGTPGWETPLNSYSGPHVPDGVQVDFGSSYR
jgi:hypothetical protein